MSSPEQPEARRATESAEAQALRRLREITDRVPGIVFELRREVDGRITLPFVSGGSFEMSGVTAAEAEANPQALLALIHPEDLPIVFGGINMANDRPVSLDYRAFHRDGRTRWVHSIATRRVAPDGAVIVTGCWQEFSREKELQDRLAKATEAAEAASRAAEAASRAKSEFLATMSHEIRTPMNGVLSFAYLGLQADPPPKLREHFARIESSARTLLSLIDDILDFSKVEAGKLQLEHAPFALSQVLDNLGSVVGLRAQEKGLGFRIEVDDDVPATMVGDSLRLGQVLLNLAGNAVKFTRQGEVLVRVCRRPGSGTSLESGPQLSPGPIALDFSVRDSGIGLTPEQIDRLFAAFTQADSSTTREFGGTGLGLSISKRLVELMGGTIDVESVPDVGSTFHFWAPFDPATVGAVESRATAADAAALSGLSVLVTDDHDINRQVITELLASVNVEVTLATSGLEAIAAVESTSFDAIFMDLRMPGMDGVEATRRIRAMQSGSTRRTPIIALTANVMAPDRDRCLAAGMDEFVGKPIKVPELFAALARCTRRRMVSVDIDAAEPAADEILDPRVELRIARERLGRRPDLYEALVRSFVQGEDLSTRLRADLLAQRFDAALLTAHTLKGFAAQVGVMQVSRLASQIERGLQSGTPTIAQVEALAAAVAEARRMLAETSGPSHQASVPADAATIARLESLLEHDLEDDEDTAWERFEALLGALSPADRERMAPVGRLIASLEYESALSLWRQSRG